MIAFALRNIISGVTSSSCQTYVVYVFKMSACTTMFLLNLLEISELNVSGTAKYKVIYSKDKYRIIYSKVSGCNCRVFCLCPRCDNASGANSVRQASYFLNQRFFFYREIVFLIGNFTCTSKGLVDLKH